MAKSLYSGGGGGGGSSGGGGQRDWAQIYAIYGSDEWQSVLFLLFHSVLFGSLSLLVVLFFGNVLAYSHSLLPSLHPSVLRCSVGFLGSFLVLSSICLLIAAANLLYSSSALRWEVSQRMVASVPDWSSVRTALDVGCGRGFLLNSVAIQLKKHRSRGRAVGLAPSRPAALSALRRARAEGVQDYVTCRDGDARSLPFRDAYFDVVVSAAPVPPPLGRKKAAGAAEERGRGLGEMVRVLRPGGVGVVWDLNCVPDLAHRLREMRMDEIRVSDRLTAYLATSHIVSFRKPLLSDTDTAAAASDWRTNIY